MAAGASGNPTITPAQLVSNSSGLVGLFPDPTYGPYLCQYLAAGTLQDCAASIFTTTDDDLDVVPPDTEFRYGGAQWQVAGAVAEAASGKSWAQLIDEIYVAAVRPHDAGLQQPLRPTARRRRLRLSDGVRRRPVHVAVDHEPEHGGRRVHRTPDYAALLLMHLRGGRCGDARVLSQAALDRMHADRIGRGLRRRRRRWDGLRHGLVGRPDTGRITDPGAYGSVPWLDLADGYGAYLVIEADATTGEQLASELFDVVESAVTTAR